MHQVAAGSAGPVGLAGLEPPLSTQTIGRAPSILELPAPLQAVPALKPAEQAEELFEGPVESPVKMAELLPKRAPTTGERRRVVVRLVGDDELDLGTFEERDAAVACAKEVVAALSAAERVDEWPEIDGRHLRPASILSVDILVAAG